MHNASLCKLLQCVLRAVGHLWDVGSLLRSATILAPAGPIVIELNIMQACPTRPACTLAPPLASARRRAAMASRITASASTAGFQVCQQHLQCAGQPQTQGCCCRRRHRSSVLAHPHPPFSGRLQGCSDPLPQPIKVVGMGSSGQDLLAQVASFPSPDDKLRTEQFEAQVGTVACGLGRGWAGCSHHRAKLCSCRTTLRRCSGTGWQKIRGACCGARGQNPALPGVRPPYRK